MNTRSHFLFTAVLLLMVPVSLRAQNAQPSSTSKDGYPNRQVIGSVSETKLRFTCLGDLIQLRLEVLGPAGEILFDSEFKPGNVVDWPAPDVKGQQPDDGTYLCVVSVKDATGEILKKYAIATVRDQSVSLRAADKSLLSSAQSASVTTGEDVNVTIVEAGAAPAAILAHDGATAHLVSGRGGLSISSGDFFSNRLLEHMRITGEGNVGIGVASPQARLDVAGAIRASQGIIFPDGSIQFSAARKTFGTASLRDGQSKDKSGEGQGIRPEIAGTGTTGQIPKWVDGPNGVLGDSVISELNGSIGINGAPNPTFKLDVNGHNRFRGSNVSFYLTGTKPGGNEWLFQTVDADGRLRIFENSTGGGEKLSLTQSGNLGIGATSPGSKLEIAGSALIYPASGPGALHIRNRTVADYAQVVFDDNNNAYRGYIGYIGFNAPLDAARKDTVEFGTQGANITFRPNESEAMRITTTGRVGIGTPAPSFRLHVIDGSNSGLRVQTNATGGTVASFGGNGAFQIDANGVAGGRFNVLENGNVGIGTATPQAKLDVRGATGGPVASFGGNGAFQIDATGVAGGRFNVLENGNVGIGTATPQAKLDVRGDVKLGSTGQLFASGSEENLRIIRGFIFDNGLISAGSGFTLTRPDIGVYAISFDTSFSGTPAVTVTCFTSNAFIATISGVGNASVTIHTFDLNSNPTNSGFLFIAIGPR